ncbi:hypothetical protein SAMN05421805_102121 [Saccharopolyspora antimicrobica]|uniref:Uncharacterized protein n=1 Tax=Saccharopolyspora antimicrobica TaxID=455193 RepID=A0A1I4VCE7_9PSEU|nr:hypothetical protein ATL45_4588 [Saccharopolyspora antimicrobica]SFM98847.1 hypothetical protein SAMN05421805_102121 [Saccharopolyspora antimicrobica]
MHVETALMLGIPGMTLLLVAVGGYEIVQKRRGKRSGTPLAGTYVDEVTALFYGTKRMELEHRDSTSMMRDEEGDGAPGVDLDGRKIVLRREDL